MFQQGFTDALAKADAVALSAVFRKDNDPLKPALDKTVSGSYPPGSCFKPFTAVAGLEKGLIDPRATAQCRGFLKFGRKMYGCTHVHGATNLHKAVSESCNVYFYELGARPGMMDRLAKFGADMGLGAISATKTLSSAAAWMLPMGSSACSLNQRSIDAMAWVRASLGS